MTQNIMKRDANLIGRRVARLRNQQNLTQNMLVARVEVLNFFGISRDVLSNIELQRYVATDKHVYYLDKALNVGIDDLFPP